MMLIQNWKLLGCDLISEFVTKTTWIFITLGLLHVSLGLRVKWPVQKSHKISYNLAQSATPCSMSCMITTHSRSGEQSSLFPLAPSLYIPLLYNTTKLRWYFVLFLLLYILFIFFIFIFLSFEVKDVSIPP